MFRFLIDKTVKQGIKELVRDELARQFPKVTEDYMIHDDIFTDEYTYGEALAKDLSFQNVTVTRSNVKRILAELLKGAFTEDGKPTQLLVQEVVEAVNKSQIRKGTHH